MIFKCPVCGEGYINRIDFINHLKLHSSIMDAYECNCSARFSTLSQFRRHFLRYCSTLRDEQRNEVRPGSSLNSDDRQIPPQSDDDIDMEEHDDENNIPSDGSASDDDDSYIGEEDEQFPENSINGDQQFPENIFPDDASEQRLTRRCSVEELWERFMLKLLSDSVLSRKKAIDFMIELNVFTIELFDYIKSKIQNFIKEENLIEYQQILEQNKQTFHMNSETQIQTFLKEHDLFDEPKIEIIENLVTPVTKQGERVLARNPKNVCMPNLKLALSLFFRRENLLKLTLKNMENLMNDTSGKISNYIQGKAWKEKLTQLEPNKQYIPLFLYNDDFEPDNALGAHKGKNSQCAFYLSCPVIPKRFRSKLNSLIPAMFINTALKKVNHERLFNTLIKNFVDIQNTGLQIDMLGRIVTIYPILCAFTGDNLSLNYIGGYTTSFNSTKFCRTCSSSKNETMEMTEECTATLRTQDSYFHDAARNNMKETGIKFKSPFASIPSFNIIHAMTFDPMHDFGEGICPLSVALVLAKVIESHDDISLQIINSRKSLFDYGMYQICNISEDIAEGHLRDGCLKMSSCEIFTFINLLPLMIGDLIIGNQPAWTYFLLLRKIVMYTFRPSFTTESISVFKKMIAEHHRTFVPLFDRPLTPKMHFLVHYPAAIAINGPLEGTDCRRYESKNRDIKQYSRVTFNRRNLSKSIAIKELYKISYHSFIEYHDHEYYLFKPKTKNVDQTEIAAFFHFEENERCQTSTADQYDNLRLNTDTCFKITNDFVKICNLILFRNNLYAMVRKINIETFSEIMQCYFVKVDDNSPIICFALSNLDNFPQTIHKLNNGKQGLLEPQYMY